MRERALFDGERIAFAEDGEAKHFVRERMPHAGPQRRASAKAQRLLGRDVRLVGGLDAIWIQQRRLRRLARVEAECKRRHVRNADSRTHWKPPLLLRET